MLKFWRNGAKGEEVRQIIEHNFNIVSKYLTKDIKALSTQERNLLSSDYLSENTLVFDTDEIQWYKYSKTSGKWIKTFVDNNVHLQEISINDWADNKIHISFNIHGIKNPFVQMFIKNGEAFIPVLGGIEIDSEYNITLSTDLPFDGKVVIK